MYTADTFYKDITSDINWTDLTAEEMIVLRAYKKSLTKQFHKLVFDWDDHLNNYSIEKIVACLKSYSLSTFVIADNGTGLMEIIHKLWTCNCRLIQPIDVVDRGYGEEWAETVHGLLFEIKPIV